MKRRVFSILLVVSFFLMFISSCFVWRAIKDRYQPYVLTKEIKDGKRKVKFVFDSPSSVSVAIAGQFNNWVIPGASVSESEKRNIILSLKKNKVSGYWERFLYLEPGKYQYKYVLDGKIWKYDQNTLEKVDDGYGGKNSVVIVP